MLSTIHSSLKGVSTLTFLFYYALWTGFALLTWRLISNRRKLSTIPGPFLASISDLWRFYQHLNGRVPEALENQHKKHGSLVRWGTNNISVSDPEALHVIYGIHPVFNKGDMYHPMTGMKDGKEVPSIVSIMDESYQSALKKQLVTAFTPNSISDYEKYIDETAEELMGYLSRMKTVNLSHWLQYFAFDVLFRIAFSETPGFMKKGEDVSGIMQAINKRFLHWNFWSAYPTVERAIYKNPIYGKIVKPTSAFAALAVQKLAARKSAINPPTHRDLLAKYLEASEKKPDVIGTTEITSMLMSTIAAGADTTAVTMTVALYYLLKNPASIEKLQKELDTGVAIGSIDPNTPRYAETTHLLYLDACIKETMRLYPFLSGPLERVVPAGGITLSGQFIPGGTMVGCSAAVIHKDRDVYGDDADQWNPDRWILADEEKRHKMERIALGFGAGKRVCLGRHIAMLELKTMIPYLLLRFRMRLVDPDMDIMVNRSVVNMPPPVMVSIEDRVS